MLKPTKTSKKNTVFGEKKMQKFQVYGKHCKNFDFLEKIAEISAFG